MDRDPIKSAARMLARQNRLEPRPKVCLLCGYADAISLIPVTSEWIAIHKDRLPRSLFEGDHIVGRNHDPDFVFAICRNCHAEITELRHQAGISMRFEPNDRKREFLRLEALALFHEKVAHALRSWGFQKYKVGREK